jgi:hypothetical protein
MLEIMLFIAGSCILTGFISYNLAQTHQQKCPTNFWACIDCYVKFVSEKEESLSIYSSDYDALKVLPFWLVSRDALSQ